MVSRVTKKKRSRNKAKSTIGLAGLCLTLLLNTVGVAAQHSSSIGLECEELVCNREIVVGFFQAGTCDEILRISIMPGEEGVVPARLINAVEEGSVSPDDLFLEVVDDNIVSTTIQLSELLSGNRGLRLWPASGLTATVAPSGIENQQHSVGDEATILLWPAEDPNVPEPLFQTGCPVTENELICRLPAGAWDLRIEMQSFSPVYKWAQHLREGQVLDLHRVELMGGATLNGYLKVNAPEVPDLSREATIEITPVTALNAMHDVKMRQIRAMKRVIHPRQDGEFVLTGVATESHLIQAFVAGVGSSAIRKIQVHEPVILNLESPIIVESLVHCVVQTGLAFDQYNKPLTLGLKGRLGDVDDLVELVLPIDPSGTTELPPIAPGTYFLTIVTSSGDELVFNKEVQVNHHNNFLMVNLEQIPVTGMVRLDNEPLGEAHIVFNGPRGEMVKTTADMEGQFVAVLTAGGLWHVDVTADMSSFHKNLNVDVVPGEPLNIELETTGIRGTVRDEALRPVSSASVKLVSIKDSAVLKTDENGQFEYSGLEPGEYFAQVSHPNRFDRSNLEVIKISSGEVVEHDFQLRFASIEVRGRLTSSDEKPVAFAEGTVFARNGYGDSIYLEPPQFSTNGDGRFLLRFPPEAANYRIVMSAEGYDVFMSSFQSILISEPFVVSRPSGGVLFLCPRGREFFY
jgi:hypothetical protein